MKHQYKIGDKVVFTNDFGVCWGVKTIIELDERSGEPTYHYEGSDTPWFSVDEINFTLADEEDLTRLDADQNWDYFQEKYGYELLPEEMGGCY